MCVCVYIECSALNFDFFLGFARRRSPKGPQNRRANPLEKAQTFAGEITN